MRPSDLGVWRFSHAVQSLNASDLNSLGRVVLTFVLKQCWGRRLSSIIVIMAIMLGMTFSSLSALLVLISYFGGLFLSAYIVSRADEIPSLLPLVGLSTPANERVPHQPKLPCPVCSSTQCRRHRHISASRQIHHQPWKGLEIPKEIDEAVTQFLEQVLQEFVHSWYGKLSKDQAFTNELRVTIRHALCLLLRRALQVDPTQLVITRILPVALSHVELFVKTRQLQDQERTNLSTEEAFIRIVGTNLHEAARSRRQELRYLAAICTQLQETLLPVRFKQCPGWQSLVREILSRWVLLPALDALADPDLLNQLLLLLLSKDPLPACPRPTYQKVEFLHVLVPAVKDSDVANQFAQSSAFATDLSTVLKDPAILYPFMQFLKSEGAVNILQFCLDADEFNQCILTPDIHPDELAVLHAGARALFQNYLASDAVDCIEFPPDIVLELQEIISGPRESILLLQTCTPLFRAYEAACEMLERIFLPAFFHSEEFYTSIMGNRLSDNTGRSTNRNSSRPHDLFGNAAGKLGSGLQRLRGMLSTTPVEGQTYQDPEAEFGEDMASEDLGTGIAVEGDRDPDYLVGRNLSAWRVSLPRIETRLDVSGKHGAVFIIDVHRIDVKGEDDPQEQHWTVERRLQDFYLLEAKLTEFHGEFTDAQLPTRRTLFGARGMELMEQRRPQLESYLRKLLQKTSLRGSELLTSFLTSRGEFSATLPEGGAVGRMIRTVPMKLSRERGQHLDAFVSAFLQSTEAPKPKPGKLEWDETPATRSRPHTSPLYGDNFAMKDNNIQPNHLTAEDPVYLPKSQLVVDGFYDGLVFLGVRALSLRKVMVQVLLSLRILLRSSLDSLFQRILRKKIMWTLEPPRLAMLIHLLREVIFEEGTSLTATRQERLQHIQQVQDCIQHLLSHTLPKWLGNACFDEDPPRHPLAPAILVDALQHPKLNKQLSYLLLDVIVEELFPELLVEESDRSTT